MVELTNRSRMLLTFLLLRFQERGTWAHLANFVCTSLGVTLKPEWAAGISFVGVMVSSVIGILVVEQQPRIEYDPGPPTALGPLPPAANDLPGAPPFDPTQGR